MNKSFWSQKYLPVFLYCFFLNLLLSHNKASHSTLQCKWSAPWVKVNLALQRWKQKTKKNLKSRGLLVTGMIKCRSGALLELSRKDISSDDGKWSGSVSTSELLIKVNASQRPRAGMTTVSGNRAHTLSTCVCVTDNGKFDSWQMLQEHVQMHSKNNIPWTCRVIIEFLSNRRCL